MYEVKGFEKREIGKKFRKVYDKWFESEEDAELIAEEVLRRMSDIYGFSYVEIYDEDGELVDSLSADYNADADPDLAAFDEEEYLRRAKANKRD